MIPDESPPLRAETEHPSPEVTVANDGGNAAAAAIDPRILIIARAIGQQIARERLDTLHTANDNRANDER